MINQQLTGILCALFGGVFLSSSGILIRNLENVDGWQILFYRSIAFFCAINIGLAFYYGRKLPEAFLAIGKPGLTAALLLGVGSVFYVFAILNTTVANVVFIIGSTPLIAALVAWIFIGESVSPLGLLAMAGAFMGIGLMFIDGLVSGGMLGNLLALSMVVTFAFYLLIIRSRRFIDMLPATGLSGLVTLMIAGFMVSSFSISSYDLIICITLGTLQLGMGFFLLTLACRYIPSAEVALFAMSESILGPLWVWIGVDEVPGRYTIYGSGVILVSVVAYCLISLRQEKRTQNLCTNTKL